MHPCVSRANEIQMSVQLSQLDLAAVLGHAPQNSMSGRQLNQCWQLSVKSLLCAKIISQSSLALQQTPNKPNKEQKKNEQRGNAHILLAYIANEIKLKFFGHGY